VEAIRVLMVAKRSARNERTQAINQARALIVTGPDDLRARFATHTLIVSPSGLTCLRSLAARSRRRSLAYRHPGRERESAA
jgi:transposase